MNAARLTMIGLLAAAFIVGACSRDNRLTGPGTDTRPGIQMNRSDNNIGPGAWDPEGADTRDTEPKPVRLTIVAKVLRTSTEGGCLYLEADKGETYTPLCPKSLTLNEGMTLKAEGYVDENIHFFCGNGPTFVIIDYEILKKSAWTSDQPTTKRASDFEPSNDKTRDAASDKPKLMTDAAEPVPIIFDNDDTRAASSGTAIEGYTRHTKSGCLMLTTAKNEVYELHSNEPYELLPQDGSYVGVTGYVSSLPYWTCEEATVFNVESITILRRPKASDQFAFDLGVPEIQANGWEYVDIVGEMDNFGPEGICWVFNAEDGNDYELIFSSPVSLRSGMRLRVKGVLANVSTFCQSGIPVKVADWIVLNGIS